MKELLRTNDLALFAYVDAVLKAEDIAAFPIDMHASGIYWVWGPLQRRLMVLEEDFDRAKALLGTILADLAAKANEAGPPECPE